jgi:hypothetical protein
MDEIISRLDLMILKAEKLKTILHDSPEIVEFIKANKRGEFEKQIPAQVNGLLGANEVAKILKVNVNRVGEYAEQGLLPYCYTPGGSGRKFKVDDVNKFIDSLSDYTKKVVGIE